MKNISKLNINEENIKENQKNFMKRRNKSFGDLEVKIRRNNESYKILPNNNYIINNSSIVSNTQSLKKIPPSYSVSTPNGYICPIIFTNNKENYMNNNMNNNKLYNIQENMAMTPNISKKMNTKPFILYCDTFSPRNQIPSLQNNNYKNFYENKITPKYINNSSNFNFIQNVNNNYSEDYLNKQIYDFINANYKTKQNIISNISKKHNIKLNKSNGNIKLNNSKTSNNNKIGKIKNNSYFLNMETNIDESGKKLSNKAHTNKSNKSSKKIKDKSFENNRIPMSFSVRPSNDKNDINDLINTNNENSKNLKYDFNNTNPNESNIKRNTINDYNKATTSSNFNKNKNIIRKNNQSKEKCKKILDCLLYCLL